MKSSAHRAVPSPLGPRGNRRGSRARPRGFAAPAGRQLCPDGGRHRRARRGTYLSRQPGHRDSASSSTSGRKHSPSSPGPSRGCHHVGLAAGGQEGSHDQCAHRRPHRHAGLNQGGHRGRRGRCRVGVDRPARRLHAVRRPRPTSACASTSGSTPARSRHPHHCRRGRCPHPRGRRPPGPGDRRRGRAGPGRQRSGTLRSTSPRDDRGGWANAWAARSARCRP
jgi:hypothetical protein